MATSAYVFERNIFFELLTTFFFCLKKLLCCHCKWLWKAAKLSLECEKSITQNARQSFQSVNKSNNNRSHKNNNNNNDHNHGNHNRNKMPVYSVMIQRRHKVRFTTLTTCFLHQFKNSDSIFQSDPIQSTFTRHAGARTRVRLISFSCSFVFLTIQITQMHFCINPTKQNKTIWEWN